MTGDRTGPAPDRDFDAFLHRELGGGPTAEDAAAAQRVVAAVFARPLPRQEAHARPRRMPWHLPAWLVVRDFRPGWPSAAAFAGMALLGFMAGTQVAADGLDLARMAAPMVRIADADLSPIVFDPDPLAENGL